MGMEFRVPSKPSIPILKRLGSVKELAGWWQEAQACVPSPESMGSKNNLRPKATPSTVCGLSAGTIGGGSKRSKIGGTVNGFGVGI